MREIRMSVTPIPQIGVRFKLTPGSIGTYENLEKLEGNHDLLEEWEDKTDFVDAQDESTWPLFLRRECAGTPLDSFHDCGECRSWHIVIDEYRGEAYCNDCGMVVSDPNTTGSMDDGYEVEPLTDFEKLSQEGRDDEAKKEQNPDVAGYTARTFVVLRTDNKPPREITVSGTWVSVEFQHPLTGKTQEKHLFFQKKSGDNTGRVSNPAHTTWLAKQNRWRRPNIVLDPIRVKDDDGKITPVYAEPFNRRR
jgi:hypothetical protein